MSKEAAAETLSIEGREVRVTHLHKPYFSKQVKLSKFDMVRDFLAWRDFRNGNPRTTWLSARAQPETHRAANIKLCDV